MHCVYLLLFFVLSASFVDGGQDDSIKRINAFLLIGDPRAASDEGKEALKLFPESATLREAYIKALAANGTHQTMLKEWEIYAKQVDEPYENRALIESMGWSIIEKEFTSQSPIIRFVAVLGAFFGQNARSIPILLKALSDQNALLRGIALQAVSTLRDSALQKKVLQIFYKEKNPAVRHAAISAIGKMKIKSAKPELLALVADDSSAAETKAVAIEAIVGLEEKVGRAEMEYLARSSRAGLRQLACRIVSFFDQTRDLDLMLPLLRDSNSEVRSAALYALAVLREEMFQERLIADEIVPLLRDKNTSTAIYAAYALTVFDRMEGQTALEHWLDDPLQDNRLLAAGALCATGRHGIPLVRRAFYTNEDDYVRLNLALTLISQRVDVPAACAALRHGLQSMQEKWMWKEESDFKLLAPSDIPHSGTTPHLPEAMDQLVRLEVLNILAIMQDPHASIAVKQFLKEQTWGISGEASVLLLTEGDESAVDIVEKLLEERDPKIRIQAALVLALWGQGETAIHALQDAYPTATREMKERILEGLGRISSKSSIPFFIDKLKERSPSLRIIAAAALIQTLNN